MQQKRQNLWVEQGSRYLATQTETKKVAVSSLGLRSLNEEEYGSGIRADALRLGRVRIHTRQGP